MSASSRFFWFMVLNSRRVLTIVLRMLVFYNKNYSTVFGDSFFVRHSHAFYVSVLQKGRSSDETSIPSNVLEWGLAKPETSLPIFVCLQTFLNVLLNRHTNTGANPDLAVSDHASILLIPESSGSSGRLRPLTPLRQKNFFDEVGLTPKTSACRCFKHLDASKKQAFFVTRLTPLR